MTTMTDFDALIRLARPWARSVPDPALISSLRAAVRRVCVATRVWRVTDTVTVTTPEATALPALADTDVALVLIEGAQIDSAVLTPASVEDLDTSYPGWRTDTDEGSAGFITQLEPPLIFLYPRVTGDLEASLVLQPSEVATEIPQNVVDLYGTIIAQAGAAMQLALPGTEYQNLQLAGELLNEFDRQIGRQHIISRKGVQRARKRTRGLFL